MNKIIVNGAAINPEEITKEVFDDYRLSNVINVSQNRGEVPHTIEYKEGDVVEIIFDDGTSWMTPANKIQDAFEKSNRSIQSGEYVIPLSVETSSQSRGVFKFFVKTIKFFSKLPEVKNTSKQYLGKDVDDLLAKNEGLFFIDDKWKLKPITDDLKKGHYLLFIHGFLSNFESAFEDIFKTCSKQKKKIGEEFERLVNQSSNTILGTYIKSKYRSNLLAFNHKTISKSPISNAYSLLEALPNNSTLDIVAHSRGGLIADLLAICDRRNEINFSEDDFSKFPKTEALQLHAINQLIKKKKIKINKIIRAGSPMYGTYLLSKNLDDFLSAVFGLIELSTKGAALASGVYLIIKEFILSVLGSRADAKVFPGIAAMVPGSPLTKMLNDSTRINDTPLFVIEGNSELGRNIVHSLSVILGNVLHRRANDFIVNTSSMRFGVLRQSGAYVCRTEDSQTTHFNYFCHPKSSNALYKALVWDFNDEFQNFEFEHYTKRELIGQFKNQFKQSRGGVIEEDEPIEIDENDNVDFLDLFYGFENNFDKEYFSPAINITLVHGNLEFAAFPVVSGHFKDQAIVSAEKSIDRCLENTLSDHYFLGKYPSDPEDNIVIYNKEKDFKGCILIGLGDAINFNDLKLRKAVENGIVSFALKMRDSHINVDIEHKNSISSLCIGSGFGGLNMDASLTAILFGVSNANKRIYEFNKKLIERNTDGLNSDLQYLTPITNIELIEMFEHKARDAFYSLNRIKELNYNLNINIPKKITKFHGGLRKLNTNNTQSYWYDVISKKENQLDDVNGKISFLSSQRGARVDETMDFYSLELVEKLLNSYAKTTNFDKKLSNSLFQLLLPRNLRPMLRGQHNIVWKMDKEIANIPWEMIHDQDSDIDPTFVNSGLVRQLITSRILPSEKITRVPHVLIIGDPKYAKYNQLEGAKAEAEMLETKFTKLPHWKVTSLIRKGYIENSLELLNSKYKLLHISGHGEYNPITKKTGLVMDDKLLDTVFFNNLENIPEMAFINCCYSGTTDEDYEKLYEHRYNISASIGTQLIEMGVQAVVVTGWAVDDQTALSFADKFYEQMLEGGTFGIATKNARRHIYENFDNKTWGAYQCYGNPWYTLVEKKLLITAELIFNTVEEVNVELFNIKKQLFLKREAKNAFEKTNKILEYVKDKWPNETKLYEKIALIYFELDSIDEGLTLIDEIFLMPGANYKVKTIEQYIYAKLKKISIGEPEDNNKEYIKDINDKLDLLFSISSTRDRHCFRGLLHMRESMISSGSKSKFDKCLKLMKGSFKEAFEEIGNKGVKRIIFPLMMYAFACFNSSPKRKRKIDFRGKSYEILPLFEILKKEVSELPPKKKNFWNDIALININTCKFILSENIDSAEVKILKKEILSSYKKEFKRSGTFRNLRAETDQFEFLIMLLKNVKRKKGKSGFEYKILNFKLKAAKEIHDELLKLNN